MSPSGSHRRPLQVGWHPDPEVPGQSRYWNGSAWTSTNASPTAAPTPSVISSSVVAVAAEPGVFSDDWLKLPENLLDRDQPFMVRVKLRKSARALFWMSILALVFVLVFARSNFYVPLLPMAISGMGMWAWRSRENQQRRQWNKRRIRLYVGQIERDRASKKEIAEVEAEAAKAAERPRTQPEKSRKASELLSAFNELPLTKITYRDWLDSYRAMVVEAGESLLDDEDVAVIAFGTLTARRETVILTSQRRLLVVGKSGVASYSAGEIQRITSMPSARGRCMSIKTSHGARQWWEQAGSLTEAEYEEMKARILVVQT
jgi:hypothetical protein